MNLGLMVSHKLLGKRNDRVKKLNFESCYLRCRNQIVELVRGVHVVFIFVL